MLFGTNMKYTKAYNYRIVLETIRLYGPISRADVARRTELTAQTVSNIVRKLIQADLVVEAQRVREGRGAPATALKLNPNGAFAIGLDLDRDHLTGLLVDLVGTVRQRLQFDLNFPPPEEAIDLMASSARTLMQQQGLAPEQIWGVGVGLPGPLGITEGSTVTNVVNPKAFPGWHNVPVIDLLSERLGLPIYLENNATAAAVGERWYGAGQHIRTFFYLYFGIGLGGGLVINGHPHRGFSGNAGEIGYFPVGHQSGRSMASSNSHLGVFFNLPRLYRTLHQAGMTVSRPAQLSALYEDRHPHLIEWLETGAHHLVPALLAIENLIEPESIFFGGRLPDALIAGLIERMKRLLPAWRIEGKPFAPALLQGTAGEEAAALGVATLPMYEAFAPAPNLLIKRRGDGQHTAFSSTQHLSLNI